MLTSEQIQGMLPDIQETVKLHVKNEVIHGLKQSLSWELQQTVSKCIKEFMEKEIVPEIHAHLITSKDGLRKAVIEASIGMTEILKKIMVEKFNENLKGYSGGEILKKMFA